MLRWLSTILALLILAALPAHAGSLRVAVEDMPPYSVWTDGTPTGPDIALAQKVASALGLKPRFIRCDRPECLTLLENGQADCMFGLKRRPALDETVWLPDRPLRMHADTAFWIKKGSGIRIERQQDLYGRTVGVIKDMALAPAFDNDPRIERYAQTDMGKLFKLLIAGQVSVVALEVRRGEAALARTGFAKWVKRAPYSLSDPDPEFMAVSRKSRLATEPDYVRSALDKTLDDAQSTPDDI